MCKDMHELVYPVSKLLCLLEEEVVIVGRFGSHDLMQQCANKMAKGGPIGTDSMNFRICSALLYQDIKMLI